MTRAAPLCPPEVTLNGGSAGGVLSSPDLPSSPISSMASLNPLVPAERYWSIPNGALPPPGVTQWISSSPGTSLTSSRNFCEARKMPSRSSEPGSSSLSLPSSLSPLSSSISSLIICSLPASSSLLFAPRSSSTSLPSPSPSPCAPLSSSSMVTLLGESGSTISTEPACCTTGSVRSSTTTLCVLPLIPEEGLLCPETES